MKTYHVRKNIFGFTVYFGAEKLAGPFVFENDAVNFADRCRGAGLESVKLTAGESAKQLAGASPLSLSMSHNSAGKR